MRIVHFAVSPMAGAPVRLVRALRRIGLDARLVDLRRLDLFGHDLVFSESPEEALALAEAADVIHLHNYLVYESSEFSPIDFRALKRKGKAFVRHFHSTPELVSSRTGVPVRDILDYPMPQLVIAQYPERFYPRAMVLPNLIPQDDPEYSPLPPGARTEHDMFFSPTNRTSAREDRWNTKGAPETVAVMDAVASATGATWRLVTGRPLAEALAAKRRSSIVLDDLVNGSYHLSGLEGLAMGKPVLSWLDGRSLRLVREFSGESDCPFLNVRLEDACEVLTHLVRNPADAEAVGRAGREFMERHWSELRLASLYKAMYRMLLEHPDRVRRQPELALEDPARRFIDVILPDLVYRSRFGRDER